MTIHRNCGVIAILTLVLLAIATFSNVCHAENPLSLASELTLNANERRAFKLPMQRNGEVYLAFSARIATAKHHSGGFPAAKIFCNGIALSELHLANKGKDFFYRADQPIPWVRDDSKITLVYYPWDKVDNTLDQKFCFDFVFNISKILRKDGSADIEFVNIFNIFKDAKLEFRNIRILYRKNFPISPLWDRTAEGYGDLEIREKAASLHMGAQKQLDTTDDCRRTLPKTIHPRRYKAPSYQFSDNKQGDLRITVKDDFASIESGWEVDGIKLKLANNQLDSGKLRVTRQIETTDVGLAVRDTMTNLTGEDLPVRYRHTIAVELDKLREFRIAGAKQASFTANTSNMVLREYSALPLLYLRYDKSSFGVYLEDSVFRNHYSAIAIDNQLHLLDDMFYLKPKHSYTTVFRIYPVADGDYYTLLNTYRQDFGLYQNIPGLHGFMYQNKEGGFDAASRPPLKTPGDIRRFFSSTGISLPALTAKQKNFFYGGECSAPYREALKPLTGFKKAAQDAGYDLPFVYYNNIHLVRVEGKKDVGADSRWEERLKDSVVRDNLGQPVPYVRDQLYVLAPRLDNTAGKQVMVNLKKTLSEGFGLFFDEWPNSKVRVAYNFSDGVSALCDRAGNIRKKIAFIPLYCLDFQKELAALATADKRVNTANHFPSTRELMDFPIIHFSEPRNREYHHFTRIAQGGRTPLTLAIPKNRDLWRDVKYFLQYGILVCYYNNRSAGETVFKKLFPIEVREIYPGTVIGTDRILTRHSGKYKLDGKQPLTAYVYSDPDGLLTRTETGDGEIELQLNPGSQVALIVAGPKAQAAVTLPDSVWLEAGNMKVRLSSQEYCFMKRIEWKNQLVSVDNPGTHYGTVFNIVGAKGFVGAGHIETGYKEQVQSLEITVDGKPVNYLEKNLFKGREIQVTKISKVRNFQTKYELNLAGDQMEERMAITSDADVELNSMYHFMHPWSTDFTDLFYRTAAGVEYTFAFKTNGKFPVRQNAPTAAWYNRQTGNGVVSIVLPGEGQKNPSRYVWDHSYYRKDYIVDYLKMTFPKNHKAYYGLKTVFFNQPDSEKWVDSVKNIVAKLQKNQ